jgi:hypothetical protein
LIEPLYILNLKSLFYVYEVQRFRPFHTDSYLIARLLGARQAWISI